MIRTRMVTQLNDNQEEIEVEEEYDDGLPDSTIEDRGDNLNSDVDEVLEVDEDIVAALAKDEADARVIPKSRFDEVNNEKNDLKAQNAILLAQIAAGTVPAAAVVPAAVVPPEETFDVDAAEEQYAEAITEGDFDRAKGLRKEIRDYEKKTTLEEFRAESTQKTAQETAETRKNTVIAQAFADNPELDHQNAAYDAALVGKINRMQASYLNEGKPADEALLLAIADFIAPKAAPVVTDKGDAAAKVRNAAAQKAQPPGLGGVGLGERAKSAASDVSTMTDSEFDALPAAEKKRLRGD